MRDRPALHDASFRLDAISIEAARHPIGPVRVGGRLVSLRPPRWSDGPSWCATRRVDEQRFRAALGSTDKSWKDSSSLVAWIEHLSDLRSRARRGLAVPFTAVGAGGDVIGEVNYYIDSATASGEISLWMQRGTPREVVQWITASTLFRVVALPSRVRRLTAPIARGNPGPRRLLAHYGFAPAAVARELREFGGEVVDHDIWWLDLTPENLDGLARGMTDPTF